MKKWQGFFLSDHTAIMKKSNSQRSTINHKKSTMTVEDVSEILMKAYANHRQVSVQLKELDFEGKLQPDIFGFVQGYQVDEVLISSVWIDLNNINHIDLH